MSTACKRIGKRMRNEPSQEIGDETGWDRGWRAHEVRQLRRLARLPFVEKLKWLEEAQEFGEKLIVEANRRKTT